MPINNPVTIERGTTSIRVCCSADGRFGEAPSVSSLPFLRRYLVENEYDHRSRHNKIKYCYYAYSKVTGELSIPIHLFIDLCNYFRSSVVEYIVQDVPANISADITIVSTEAFQVRDDQSASIEFLKSDQHMKSLELQTGCLAGDMVINFHRAKNGFSTTLKNAYERFNQKPGLVSKLWRKDIPTYVRSFTGERIQLHEIEDIVYSGIRSVYLVTLENGLTLKCTIDHKIMTSIGMVPAKYIMGKDVMCDNLHAVSSGNAWKKITDHYLVISKNHPHSHRYQNPKWNCYRIMRHRAMYDAHHMNNMTITEFCEALKYPDEAKLMKFVDPNLYDIHHKDGDHDNDRPDNLECMLKVDHQQYHAKINISHRNFNQGIPSYSPAISFKYIGEEPTYDIVCKDPYHNFVANGMVVHNSGKSFIAIESIIAIQKRALIILPAGLVVQWADSFAVLSDAKIGVIRGSKTIFDLVSNEYDTDCDIMLASISTLRDYALGGSQYDILPPFRTFIRKMKFGVKIVDECHLSFHSNAMIDIQSDIEHNIYLSATHQRSSRNSEAIFKRIYPESIRFDGGNDYNRYVNITEANYSLGSIDPKYISVNDMYSQYRYEKYIMRNKRVLNNFFDNMFVKIVEDYFINLKKPGQKLLVLVGLTDFAKLLVEWFERAYPDLNSTVYLHQTDEEVLISSDVIVSTIGSAGVGKDIKGLRSMILLTSFASEAVTYQTLGRLRKMEDTPEFIYCVNTGIRSHRRHAEVRRLIYRKVGKSFQTVNY